MSPRPAPAWLWGDSDAESLYPGLSALSEGGKRFAMNQFTASACPPVVGVMVAQRPNCRAINDMVLQKLIASRPEVVLLAANWSYCDGNGGWEGLDPAELQGTAARLRDVAAQAESGATVCTTPKGVAERADIVFVMVPDTPDVAAVLFGDDGVAKGLSKGKTVVDMSSILPIETKDFAKRINALGCDYLDAPVSGGEVGAKAASLTIMVGGPDAAFERIKPLFELMGKNITRVGGNGDGQTCKVANQIIVALNIAAVGEALVFASKAGADPARVRAALMGDFAVSRILEVHGERMLKRTFAPGFRIGLHQKDLNRALAGARALGVALPQAAGAAQLMQVCVANGMQNLDHSALVKAPELMADQPVMPDAAA